MGSFSRLYYIRFSKEIKKKNSFSKIINREINYLLKKNITDGVAHVQIYKHYKLQKHKWISLKSFFE